MPQLPSWLSWPVAAYALVSLVTFLVYGWDKWRAQGRGRRVPEATLHLFALVGGWPGALAGRSAFRHKTRKQPFTAIFWLIGALHAAVWVGYLVS